MLGVTEMSWHEMSAESKALGATREQGQTGTNGDTFTVDASLVENRGVNSHCFRHTVLPPYSEYSGQRMDTVLPVPVGTGPGSEWQNLVPGELSHALLRMALSQPLPSGL